MYLSISFPFCQPTSQDIRHNTFRVASSQARAVATELQRIPGLSGVVSPTLLSSVVRQCGTMSNSSGSRSSQTQKEKKKVGEMTGRCPHFLPLSATVSRLVVPECQSAICALFFWFWFLFYFFMDISLSLSLRGTAYWF